MGCNGSSHTPTEEEAVVPKERAGAGASGAKSTTAPDEPEKPQRTGRILCSGADKDIFAGTFGGRSVAICVSRLGGGGWRRIQNEIKVFQAVGSHPHIIEMYSSGLEKGSLYMVLEVVEPIGFDLDRLKNTYSFAGQTVPSSLMARLYRQLVDALGHMHQKSLIHMDLKTENVLIDSKHDAKLIDMGIARRIGTKECLRAGYLAPELCEGTKPLGVKVDSWGLGLILHQIYQSQWKILTDDGPVKMLDGRPSSQRPMEKAVREAMVGLLRFSPPQRWHLKDLAACDWLQREAQEASQEWHQPLAGDAAERHFLRPYSNGGLPLPSALAVFITMRNHEHIIGKTMADLALSKLGVTVLLFDYGKGDFERIPGAGTRIRENSWVYFGVPHEEGEMERAVEGLENILVPEGMKDSSRKTSRSSHSHSPSDFRAFSKQEVIKTGKMIEFTVEFDCFSFPKHIGDEATIGVPQAPISPSKVAEGLPAARALNLRRVFKINLVGIHRMGEQSPVWFPQALSVVRPDDLGLVVRVPCQDGSTKPTLKDEDLRDLMDEERFRAALAAEEAGA